MKNEIDKKYELAKKYYYGDDDIDEDYEKASDIAKEIAPNLDYKKYKDEFGMEKWNVKNKYQWGEYLERNHDGIYELILELAGIYGDENTKLSVAKVYYQGTYTKQNYEEAYKIFHELIEKYNNCKAKLYIARMYYLGIYLKQDYKKAFELFNEIAEEDEDAREFIRDMYDDSNRIEKHSMSFNFWEEVIIIII